MSEPELHSIILNLNKNYSKNKGYDFSTLLNKQIELKPNSLVALYNGSITRKPIVLPEDTTITLELNSALPTTEQLAIVDLSGANLIKVFQSPDIVIPAGRYSKLTFCRVLCEAINKVLLSNLFQQRNTSITPVSGGNLMTDSLPYQIYYEMENGSFFLGLRYEPKDRLNSGIDIGMDLFQTSFEDLDDDISNTSQVTVSGTYSNIINRTTALPNWDAWALGNSPIRGMGSHSNEDSNLIGSDIGFSSCLLKGELAGTGTKATEFVFGLNNTYYSSEWAGGNGATATVKTNQVESETSLVLPQVLLGAYLDLKASTTEYTKQRLVLYCANNLSNISYENMKDQTDRDTQADLDYTMLLSTDLSQYNIAMDDGCEMTWEVYSENTPPDSVQNNILLENRKYYFRFLINSPSNSFNSTILYDSKNVNLYINYELVESGYLFQQAKCYSDNNKATSLGLCPQFYFNNSDTDLKVINPRTNNIVSYVDLGGIGDDIWIYHLGQLGYSFFVDPTKEANPNPAPLTNILGVATNDKTTVNNNTNSTTIFSPNMYPRLPELGGITQLGSDLTRYNIELNLPVRCFNTTEQLSNDVGQTRTIIHNTNPVIADTTNISSGVITSNLEPFNLKFLSLNNPDEIKLNRLDLKIRRAKTNQLADEIEDASIEILVKRD